MDYRKLGNTDIDVSVICLGTMTFGEQNTEAEAHEQLNYAVERGINFIDTAELYAVPPRKETQGKTEEYIGTWLKNRQDRDKLIVASKAVGPGAHVDYLRGGPDFSPKQLREAVEGSLRRLQTEYIDLYQLHWPERNTNFFGKRGFQHDGTADSWTDFKTVLETLQALKDEGKIRYIGLSNETPWGLMQFLRLAEQYDLPRVVSIQNAYSLLNRQFEVGLAEMSVREKVGLLAYSPLGMGILTGKYLKGAKPEGARLTRWTYFKRFNSQVTATAVEEYCALADEYGISPAQMALSFVNSRPFVTSNIIGATSMKQLKENIDSIDLQLSDELIKKIEAIHSVYPDPAP